MNRYIVIGGGIVGSSVAFHLAKEKANVILIDREDQGRATDAAAGIICPWTSQRRNKKWYALAKGGAAFYPYLIEQLQAYGHQTGYKRVGAICLHYDSDKLQSMEERVYKRREEAPEIGEVTRLSSEEVITRFPVLSDGYEAIYVSGAARVDGRALRRALIHAAIQLGTTYVKGSATLLHKNGRVIGATVGNERYEADGVIVAAGVWAKPLLLPLGIDFLITPQRAQIVHLKHNEQHTDHWPVVMPPNNQYLLAFPKGKIVVGATHEDDVGIDCRVTAGGLYEVLHKALTIAPYLSDWTHTETRVGFRPHAPNFLPIFGAVPHIEGLYVANGLGASGLTAGPYVGAELAKMILGQSTTLQQSDYDVIQAIQFL
ncbi:NAD(P)/FAD-dependent oxidoreductase [Anoxybacillus flavithermus]|uniref:Glycine/D-amino acid oxidase n=1 Tax=Anoxybacillus flavithermus AK1 TaxID=1297581 RepID=M8DX60_9BACL|nr:FAD-dependent oxidoreductase [Anoxybacillus flavithermus]EMT45369.1 glycine/D-amino acid oxidase [Anoxybacillus flavithermus AK1]